MVGGERDALIDFKELARETAETGQSKFWSIDWQVGDPWKR